MWHVCEVGGGKVHTGVWWGNLRDRERPLGRRRLRWEDNIIIELREIVWEAVD
jgi:hypothetical protein